MKKNIMITVYAITTISLEKRTLYLETGLDKYILKVPFAYSPETISAATIVAKNGICPTRIAMIK